MNYPILLTYKDITSTRKIPNWFLKEYKVFRDKILDTEFPCYFGTNAERAGHLRYTYIDRGDMSHLPTTLTKFLELSRSQHKTRYALALFVEPELYEKPLDFYKEQFWNLLQWLHKHDPKPWPEDMPQDPEHPRWEYCFAGEPMFVFSSTSAYRQRPSRNLGKSLILLFQPRRVFRGIEGGTPGGITARTKIRAKMLKYDGMPYHPEMGSYGDPSSFEWKQYFLPDGNTPVTEKCPFYTRENKIPLYLEMATSKEGKQSHGDV